MIRINDIKDKVLQYNTNANLDIIDKAYIYSAKIHAGHLRLSGEPYLSHPLEVANILAEMNLDTVSIAAGFLHDVIEDSHTTKEDIEEMFGKEICRIVEGVTKISVLKSDEFRTVRAKQAESLRKMIFAMADDIRVIFIKLADRIHNMRTLEYHKKQSKMEKIARETFDIYVPIAARLGIGWIKEELEDTAFQYLYPEKYMKIKDLVAKSRTEREVYVDKVRNFIKEKMEKANLNSEVLGRYKYFYSIYNKMKQQWLEFEDVYDIIAFRIILDNVAQCYAALGIIHTEWKHIPKRFKDYISSPKPNMYQSIHTTVLGPQNERIEIQIRTKEMDNIAKSGIAAHWSYKEGKTIDEDATKIFSWLRTIVENLEGSNEPEDILNNVKIDLFPDEVYVFTPNGEVKTLPKGATPIDFAYSIHSEVGDECIGAKVNKRMVALKYELKTGDSVEITTQKGHKPSLDWLNSVKTVKAKSKINQHIRAQKKERSLSFGKDLCTKSFRKNKLNFKNVMKSNDMDETVKSLGFKTFEDLMISVGDLKTTPLKVFRKYLSITLKEEPEKFVLEISKTDEKANKTGKGIIVEGFEDILTKFGKCCQPVPGESIIGYVTRGYGVTVHRKNCVNAVNMDKERTIPVYWGNEKKDTYPVKIKVIGYDRIGLLEELASACSKNKVNIISVKTKNLENKMADILLTISVENLEQLNKVLSALKNVNSVDSIGRLA
jgi:GTP diphosphokinase / guanosine-3',5'-bis(diphosphate) 3'-diphosphatase